MKRLADWIIRNRLWVIIFTALLTVFMAYFLKDLKVDPDVFDYLPEDDPKAQLFREVGDKYGGNYIGIIGLEAKDVFNLKTLEDIKRVTDSLQYMNGIGSVTSLTNVIDIKSSDWGIDIGKLVDEYNLPSTPEALKKLKDYTLSKKMYRGSLVSDDATFTAVMVRISDGVDKIEVAKHIKEKIGAMHLDEKVYYGGMPFAIESLGDIIMGDLLFLAPLTALVIIIILFLSFRSWRGVIMPLLTVAISIIWTIGLMGVLGIKISIISDVIPVILLAVGSAYTIHVLNRINESKSIKEALAYIIIPVSLAAVTTMAGFISFIFGSYLTMISTFGIFMALGVAFALILSVTFAPAVMAVAQVNSQKNISNHPNRRFFLHKPLEAIKNLVFHHPKRVLIVWGIIFIIAIGGMFLIQRKVDVIDYFKKNDPTYISEKIFREKFGGTMPVYVLVKGDMQDPRVLQAMDSIAVFMKSSKDVTNTQSVADLIEEMNDVMGEGKVIPNDKAKIQQLWFLLDGQDVMDQLVSFDLKEGMINATFKTGDLQAMQTFTRELQHYINQHKSPYYQMSFTGLPSLYLRIDHSLLNSQMQSLAYATLLVFLLVGLILKSLKRGVNAIIPILATLALLFGFMGLSGLPLDIATVLVGSVSIGIGVDYAIHMITHIDHELKQGQPMKDAVGHALSLSGKSITINVLSVALGFLVLVFSSMVPLQRFGLLVAVTMFASGAAALTLLPAMLIILQKKSIKN